MYGSELDFAFLAFPVSIVITGSMRICWFNLFLKGNETKENKIME